MTRTWAVPAALLGLTLGGAAEARVLWRGDFETGDLSQWTKEQKVAPDRLQVVGGAREGRAALRALVRQGDDPIDASGNRNELVHQSPTPEGAERWFRWSVKFADDFPSDDSWQIFTQWHHDGCCGSPPLLFYAKGGELVLALTREGLDPEPVWRAPLVRGRWIDLVLHVRWSSTPAEGFVELYKDGELALPLTRAATLYPGQGNMLKAGLYRDERIQPPGVVYLDGFVEATEKEDVLGEGAAAHTAEASYSGDPGSGCGGAAALPLGFVAARRRRRR